MIKKTYRTYSFHLPIELVEAIKSEAIKQTVKANRQIGWAELVRSQLENAFLRGIK